MVSSKTLVFLAGAMTCGVLASAYGLVSGAFYKSAEQAETTVVATTDAVSGAPSVESQVDSLRLRTEAVASESDDSSNIELIVELAGQLEQLATRVTLLEQRITSDSPAAETSVQSAAQALPPIPEVSSRAELIDAGLDPFVVDEITTLRDELQLQRLELRDQATREGWLDSDRFRDAISALGADSQLKASLGDDAFDRLLLAEGRDNRIRVDSVIAGSAADLAGVQAGDVIYRYADARIFTFGDLRGGTTGGERDEPVALQIFRGGEQIDLVIPRGPLGVTISGVSVDITE
jgi:hypothetical protein